MINEAIGKILGMAMAYAVSALGLLLAYYNYRKRVVKADPIMSPAAWGVIIAVLLTIALGVFTVYQLAGPPPSDALAEPETAVADDAPLEETVPEASGPPPRYQRTGEGWPWIGIVLPGAVFLLATWLTAALHQHFSTHGHGPDAHHDSTPGSGG